MFRWRGYIFEREAGLSVGLSWTNAGFRFCLDDIGSSRPAPLRADQLPDLGSDDHVEFLGIGLMTSFRQVSGVLF